MSCSSTANMMSPMAQQLKGRAIIAVCDLSKYPEIARRERAEAGTLILYRDGIEVARTTSGVSNPAFNTEMRALGVSFGG